MSVIYTIGYEGTDIDHFVSTLNSVGVMILADVRAIAHSRKKGFSKSALKSRVEDDGIEYTHISELGDPKPGRDAARSGRYEEFRRIYEEHLSQPTSRAALIALAELAIEAPTCLLCFERDPITCHRSIVADRLESFGLEVCNLFGDDPNRYVRNNQKLPRFHSRKGAAAA